MKDIVDAALAAQDSAEVDENTDAGEFGEPEICLIGYGDSSPALIDQGWTDRYQDANPPTLNTHHIADVDDVPDSAIEADYAILTGSAADHEIATAIGDRLSDEITSIGTSQPT